MQSELDVMMQAYSKLLHERGPLEKFFELNIDRVPGVMTL